MNPEDKEFLLSSYSYDLPEDRIAQTPPEIKGQSRLLVMNRGKNGTADEKDSLIDTKFENLPDYLPKNALLVANNTRVLPARIMGHRSSGGKVEFLLLTPLPLVVASACPESNYGGMEKSAIIECLLRPSARIHPGETIKLGADLGLEALEKGDFGKWKGRLFWKGNPEAIFSARGKIPLPPYIRREPQKLDEDRYQTVYARITGSVAAPTAGLHFTEDLRNRLLNAGFGWGEATLHVGYGTFSPVRCDDIRMHKMHPEYVEISSELAGAVMEARTQGRPVIAVGTTSLRALEGVAGKIGGIREFSGWTDIFLYPGEKFKIVDGLITNFHLPQSTLLMLVSAFAGRRRVLKAYEHAIKSGYRFFSYGDAMLIR